MSSTAITKGAHHIGLTVPDLARTSAFFMATLGFAKVGENADYPAIFLSDKFIMITLRQAGDLATAAPFERKNVIGLHHLALKVENSDALDALHRTLSMTDDVEIEFAPEPLGDGPARHMMCAIPGGIRVELIAA
jgi:catechol 2,3-dioxygenase-like lactoylglutathione lyase family enzyme